MQRLLAPHHLEKMPELGIYVGFASNSVCDLISQSVSKAAPQTVYSGPDRTFARAQLLCDGPVGHRLLTAYQVRL